MVNYESNRVYYTFYLMCLHLFPPWGKLTSYQQILNLVPVYIVIDSLQYHTRFKNVEKQAIGKAVCK